MRLIDAGADGELNDVAGKQHLGQSGRGVCFRPGRHSAGLENRGHAAERQRPFRDQVDAVHPGGGRDLRIVLREVHVDVAAKQAGDRRETMFAVVPPQIALRPANCSVKSAISRSRDGESGGPVTTRSRRGSRK
jgi:hypothetical protein